MDTTEQEAIKALLDLEEKIGKDAAHQIRIIAAAIGMDLLPNQALVRLMGILAVQRETLIVIQESAKMGLDHTKLL